MSTNTVTVPSKSLNPRIQHIFSSMLAAHGNGTRGIKNNTSLACSRTNSHGPLIKAKWVSPLWDKLFSQASSGEDVKHFPIGLDTVNLFWKGTKATSDFHSLELKLQKFVWLCRWKTKKRSPDYNETPCYRKKNFLLSIMTSISKQLIFAAQ